MNHVNLGWRLGAINWPAVQQHHIDRQLNSLAPRPVVFFTSDRIKSEAAPQHTQDQDRDQGNNTTIAHHPGTTCLTIDHNEGNTLISGGADGTIHLWDLVDETQATSNASPHTHHATASLFRGAPSAHTHSITSLSIYPFDPTPKTLLSTSHDRSLKLTSITPSVLQPIHTFPTQGTIYTHHISPIPSSSPLIALATSHPTIPLIDLRSSHSIQSLPGHSGSIYSLSFSPIHPHILASGDTHGRVLIFDIRRASPALASLDLDDSIGVIGADPVTGSGARSGPVLNYNHVAHSGPVTTVLWTDNGRTLVTAGHDQRIRLWDAATGRNELVHFGPRVRNARIGNVTPLLTPTGKGKHEILLWPNDDARGEIHVYGLREGNLVKFLRTPGVSRTGQQQQRSGSSANMTSAGRINGLAWRWNANAVNAGAVELYSAHGDGRIVAWRSEPVEDEEGSDHDGKGSKEVGKGSDDDDAEARCRKKRKKNLDGLAGLVEGLTGLRQ